MFDMNKRRLIVIEINKFEKIPWQKRSLLAAAGILLQSKQPVQNTADNETQSDNKEDENDELDEWFDEAEKAEDTE